MRVAIMLTVLVACGRIGFAPTTDGARADTRMNGDATGPIPGLVLWYPMDDDLSNGADDASGNGHAAVCPPGCPTTTVGHIGDAGLFGMSRRLRTPHQATLETPDGFTVAAWIRIDTYVPFSGIFSRPFANGTNNTFQLEFGDSFVPRFKVAEASGLQDVIAGSVTLGVWAHLAGTWDGALIRLYVDGAEVGNNTAEVVFDIHDLYVGADSNGGMVEGHFDGAIDDVRLYDRALRLDEIMLLSSM